MTLFFFFNDTATTEIYTLSLHDALPIYRGGEAFNLPLVGMGILAERSVELVVFGRETFHVAGLVEPDRKSTRLNSSHSQISYAVFCLKKKKYRGCSPTSWSFPAPVVSNV